MSKGCQSFSAFMLKFGLSKKNIHCLHFKLVVKARKHDNLVATRLTVVDWVAQWVWCHQYSGSLGKTNNCSIGNKYWFSVTCDWSYGRIHLWQLEQVHIKQNKRKLGLPLLSKKVQKSFCCGSTCWIQTLQKQSKQQEKTNKEKKMALILGQKIEL